MQSSELTSSRLGQLGAQVPTLSRGPLLGFDLETTGLQRGSGTVPFLYGWAILEGDWIQVEQWLLPDLGEERPLVEAALHRLASAGLLLTYNGSGFDLPLLRVRTLMAGVAAAWPAPPHVDLLPLVRRLFRHRLDRCTLRRAEEELLGRARHDDLPGSQAPERYRAYLRTGDARGLAPVLRHNQEDLVSLLALASHLGQHLEVEPQHPADWYSLGRFREARGQLLQAGALYERAALGAPAPLDRAAALRQARLLRRQEEPEAAEAAWRRIWERWADPEAAEALCVELEHQRGDLAGALELAQQALARAPVGWDRRFAKRIWRLQARLQQRGRPPEPGLAGEPSRPWAAWLPGGVSYEAWLTLRRGRAQPAPEGELTPVR
ncbi:MAG: ribonuclease H-like domain-containing protein [Candidatus Dormibacteria bacterium]